MGPRTAVVYPRLRVCFGDGDGFFPAFGFFGPKTRGFGQPGGGPGALGLWGWGTAFRATRGAGRAKKQVGATAGWGGGGAGALGLSTGPSGTWGAGRTLSEGARFFSGAGNFIWGNPGPALDLAVFSGATTAAPERIDFSWSAGAKPAGPGGGDGRAASGREKLGRGSARRVGGGPLPCFGAQRVKN